MQKPNACSIEQRVHCVLTHTYIYTHMQLNTDKDLPFSCATMGLVVEDWSTDVTKLLLFDLTAADGSVVVEVAAAKENKT